MKIAIYGGAFNPVHNEHVNIVRAAVERLGLDKVIVIPTAVSPHKRTCMTARGRERLETCRLAFADIPQAEVSDIELKRGGVSYSYVTCRHFAKKYKDDELYFIIGADMLATFHLWREPEEILKCVTLAVCAREDERELVGYIKEFRRRLKSETVDFGYVGKPVSSTRVRVLAALGEDTAGLVPEAVRQYIKRNGLYALPELRGVKKYLDADRWEHTVRVTVSAAEHARIAGVYEIKDEDILNAVRYHTTGRENMSPLEKLVYLADLLEEGRTFDGVEKLRKKFNADLNDCLKSALKMQIKYLESTGNPVCNLTRRAYEYLTDGE